MYVCVRVFVCVRVHACVCVCVHACACVSVCVCMCVCVCGCVVCSIFLAVRSTTKLAGLQLFDQQNDLRSPYPMIT